ncbi:MAG: formate dehydrogenase subunit gamma [Chloroflexota bacterium]
MDRDTLVRKAGAFEIMNHWVLAVSCFILTVTGFAFLFHLKSVVALFGGAPMMKDIHNWAGVVFAVSLVLTMFNYLREAFTFDTDDLQWMKVAGGYLSKKVKVPPMGKLNSGQKLYYIALLGAGITISATGFVIWLLPENKQWMLISHLFHNISFILFMIAVPVHIYLATIANPGTLRIMLSGKIPYWWAKKKHPKWLAEVEAHGHES